MTLLNPSGVIIGRLGGELNTERVERVVAGITPAVVAKKQGKPFTIIKDSAHFRVLARLLPSGAGSAVAALSLEDVERTLGRLQILFLFIGLLVLLLVGVVSRVAIRLSMKPLTAVEGTAEAIANGDLSARLPDAKPNSEVGRLTASLNRMLGRIEESFSLQRRSEEKLRRFVADASHELRTPLTAIRGFAELHRQGAITGEEKTKELVGRIENESKRMSALVEDLLTLARLDQARPIVHEAVDMKKLIDEVAQAVRASNPSANITVILPDDEVFVLGDSLKVHQAILNLAVNAAIHTPAGTPITITLLSGAGQVQVKVSDLGPGLTPEQQTRVFERFYRVDQSRARSGAEGSGLGLSIVQAIMDAHHGSVEIQSELGRGTTFTLVFPVNES
ncbi:MAG: HAMP domain-containing protein [Actinobacteria bacterium]|nr:HAMP domain-containing protein [Actinomycetota bacterium]